MNWVYYIEKEKGDFYKNIFVRPIDFDEAGEKLGGKVAVFEFMGVGKFVTEPFLKSEEETIKHFQKMYFEVLEKEGFTKEVKDLDDEIYLMKVNFMLKEEVLDIDALLAHIKDTFFLKGIAVDSLEKTDFDDFTDTNPLLRWIQQAGEKMKEAFGDDIFDKKSEE